MRGVQLQAVQTFRYLGVYLHQDCTWTEHVQYRTPANYWAGQINFGWSKNGHAKSVAAVQFRVTAGGCGPNAFASFVLFRKDVVQIKFA